MCVCLFIFGGLFYFLGGGSCLGFGRFVFVFLFVFGGVLCSLFCVVVVVVVVGFAPPDNQPKKAKTVSRK